MISHTSSLASQWGHWGYLQEHGCEITYRSVKSEAFTEPCSSHQHGADLWMSLLEHLAQLAGSYTRVSSSLAIDHCLYNLGRGTFAFYFLSFLSLIASISPSIGGNRYMTYREGSHDNCRVFKLLFWWDIYFVSELRDYWLLRSDYVEGILIYTIIRIAIINIFY